MSKIHEDKAVEYYSHNFNCSQAVFTTYATERGIDEKLALRIATNFGGGARKGEMCGAVSGALMVIHIENVIDKHIEYCSGCFTCMRNIGTCVYDDDMAGILREITESDLLVFSFPLYAYGMPAPMKAVIDRLLPLTSMEMREVEGSYRHVGRSDFSNLKFVMICGCGFPNSRNNFEPVVDQFKKLFTRNHTIITIPESPMFSAPEAAPVTVPRLELVKKAGKIYAENFCIPEDLLAEIKSPMIPEEQYARIVNQ